MMAGMRVVVDERLPRARGSRPPRRARATPAASRRRGTRGRTARGARRTRAAASARRPCDSRGSSAPSSVIAKGLFMGSPARLSREPKARDVAIRDRLDAREGLASRGRSRRRGARSASASRRYSSTLHALADRRARTTSPSSASKSGKRPDSTARRATWIVVARRVPQPSGQGTCTWR